MNICYSGGAKGADTIFGEQAAKAGHKVVHYRPKNVKDPEIKKLADQQLILANKYLKRTYPTDKESVNDLLRRNYLQIRTADKIYAVTPLNENMIPYGGTAWAIVMGMNYGIEEIYVFDYVKDCWYEYNGVSWNKVRYVPEPEGEYAGIGSRVLPENGVKVIKSLYRFNPLLLDL